MNSPALEPEFTTNYSATSSYSEPTAAFFPNAQHFVVSGGTFTNSVTYVMAPGPENALGDIQIIPLGELDLQREIFLDIESGMASRRRSPQSVRRVYSAQIDTRDMIVTIYEGIDAEENWQQEMNRYSGIRHPNFLQLYKAVKSFGLHGLVFHDDLIPVANMYRVYRDSPLSAGYLKVFLGMEFQYASQYFQAVSGTWLNPEDCTLWIRPSTGRLCIDFWPSGYQISPFYFDVLLGRPPLIPFRVLGPDQDCTIVYSFQLKQYHELVLRYLSTTDRFSIETGGSVQLGSIISGFAGPGFKRGAEIAYTSDCALEDFGWHVSSSLDEKLSNISPMGSGWTRFDLSMPDVESPMSTVTCKRRIQYGSRSPSWGDLLIGRKVEHHELVDWWLAQANYIFHCLGITSGLEHHILIDSLDYHVQFEHRNDRRLQVSEGYLFLCPLQDLQIGTMPRFHNPERSAYWSLDPSGARPLSKDEAESLGFPALTMRMVVSAWSWDDNTYAALHKFHRGKGFDPNTQEVARHLGFPLYQPVHKTVHDCDALREIDECSIKPETSVFAVQGSQISCNTSPPENKLRCDITSAIRRAQNLEAWLDDDSLVAFIEILETDSKAAEAYCAIEREVIRVKWVRRKLGITS
ncbi:hypothetical protein DFH09DRAFT_1276386 [Mycena vulgaris]|nr:hypothetical protein DFH09DRAFT_1276386 [Mycena vulgaris]